ncbi:MAG: (2Fe-2S)-binding protein [Deltaproteobacteria bacterium]|jgi:NADH dehydrogenase/NADH:ubiquinone oxidoreductase subunit G|nr:(2Fe-2S)-binding protein [Deltaproteobacteria bacterium]
MDHTLPKVTGTIDGHEFEVCHGTTLLEAAKTLGIKIPTLCHHPGLPPDGNCRLCLVETGDKLLASCAFPIRASGGVYLTHSPLVFEARAFVLKLLLSRAPNNKELLKLAEEYGAQADPRLSDDPDGCLRCARCVRACQAAGSQAIALIGRGRGRKVAGPFFEPPLDCVGCLACARSCPTGLIACGEEPRVIWGRQFDLVKCPQCGRTVGTPEELKRAGITSWLCPDCRRREYSQALKNLPEASFVRN